VALMLSVSCKKENEEELIPDECWDVDYEVINDNSIYYDGIFRFRIGNNWTYQKTDWGPDTVIIDTVQMEMTEIRFMKGKNYWYGYFGCLAPDGTNILTPENNFYGPNSPGDCPIERPFLDTNTPSSFEFNWHHNPPSYNFSYHTDTIETISGNYPEYYRVYYYGSPYVYYYIVENVGVVKYIFNPGVGFEYNLISYSIQ
jgi:hypothetical protein